MNFFFGQIYRVKRQRYREISLKHETGCSKNGPLIDILRKLISRPMCLPAYEAHPLLSPRHLLRTEVIFRIKAALHVVFPMSVNCIIIHPVLQA